MKKKKINSIEAYTSTATAILLYILAILQYKRENKFWWIILIAGVFMTVNAYVKNKRV